jgi:DNA-binding NarL/FixJ family response regulator
MTRIMIVEDNQRARRAIKALISQQAEVNVISEASNGQEAIQKIKEQIPDVILMDMQMPVMDGLEATKAIKAKWSQIKIIVLTMYPDYQTAVMQAGADAFILKGCPVDELVAKIRKSQKQETTYALSIPNFFLAYISPQIMYSPHA